VVAASFNESSRSIMSSDGSGMSRRPFGRPDISEAVIERIELAKAIRDLPRRQREVIALRYFADLPDAEVALVLGISHATERNTSPAGQLAALRPRFQPTGKEQLDEL